MDLEPSSKKLKLSSPLKEALFSETYIPPPLPPTSSSSSCNSKSLSAHLTPNSTLIPNSSLPTSTSPSQSVLHSFPTPNQVTKTTFISEDHEDNSDINALKITYRASEDEIKDFLENICTEDQRERFYAFRRIRFHHPSIRKLSTAVTGTTAPKSLPLVISALTRTYLSQIIDYARKAMLDQGLPSSTPLSPFFLMEGYRQYHAKVKANGAQSFLPRKRLF